MMRLRADIGELEDGVGSQFALDGEVVAFGVGRGVAVVEGRVAGDGRVIGPVDGVVGMAGRGSEGRDGRRKRLRDGAAFGRGKRRGEQGKSAGAVVVVAVGRVGAHDARREAFKGGVEDAEGSVDAALAGGAEEFVKETTVRVRRSS